jgi:hypothetical protein
VATHQISPNIDLDYVDKRRTSPDFNTRTTRGVALFTTNAVGTTTTLVGADAVPATNDNNVVRRGEKFRLFASTGVLKQETVFTITGIASAAGTTTVTFSPAAAANTASGDIARQVDTRDYQSQADMDTRLLAIGYAQSRIDVMTLNDKIFAIRTADDPGSL